MRWRDAHRVAMVAAQHASSELVAVDTTRGWADPYAAARNAGVLVAFRPLRALSGVYVRDSLASGILVNSRHPAARQRYSAAHELGHHWLGHASTADRDPEAAPASGRVVRMRDDEMVAEAFAAWFLMPRSLVTATLGRMSVSAPANQGDAYQLALRLGTSFQATVRQLQTLRLVPPALGESWLRDADRGALARLKRSYAPVPLTDAHRDVWLLGDGDRGRAATLRPGDRLVLPLQEVPSSGYAWQEPSADGWRVTLGPRVLATDGVRGAHPTGQATERLAVLDAPVDVDGPATTTVGSDLARPWDPADVADRFRFEATVLLRRPGVDQALLAVA